MNVTQLLRLTQLLHLLDEAIAQFGPKDGPWRQLTTWKKNRQPRVMLVGAEERNIKAYPWLRHFFDVNLTKRTNRGIAGLGTPPDMTIVFSKFISHMHQYVLKNFLSSAENNGTLPEDHVLVGVNETVGSVGQALELVRSRAPWFAEAADIWAAEHAQSVDKKAIKQAQQDKARAKAARKKRKAPKHGLPQAYDPYGVFRIEDPKEESFNDLLSSIEKLVS